MKPEKNLDWEIKKELEEEILFSAIREEIDKGETLKQKTPKTRKKPKKRKRYTLKKDIQIKTVLILLVTLIVNTYAWFIYISTVSTSLSMHIRDWKFELLNGAQSEDFTFTVDQIYPGVKTEDTVQEINAINSSNDTTAVLTCEIKYLKILYDEYEDGQTYTTDDGKVATYDSEKLLDMINNDYPFEIQILLVENAGTDNEIIHKYDGKSEFEMVSKSEVTIRMQVVWPYEKTGDDIVLEDEDLADTTWGTKSYKFSSDPDHKGEYSIIVKMDIKAIQKEGRPETDSTP